jgi:hypothetical protein
VLGSKNQNTLAWVLLLRESGYRTMDRKNLIQQVVENREEEENALERIPVCGANLVSPVTDTANFIEVHYRIGTASILNMQTRNSEK